MNEEPFAAGFNARYKLAGDGRVVVKAREQRIGGAEDGDGLAGESTAQVAGGAKDGIALRHFLLHLGAVCGMRTGVLAECKRDAAQVHAERAGMESGVHEEAP